MCHIEIATADYRFLFLKLQKIGKKIFFPFHPVFQPSQFTLGIGGIYCYKIKLRKFQSNHSAFFVMFFYSHSVCYGQRLSFCKNSSSGISPSVGIIPVLMITRKFQLYLSFLTFGFLQTENICIQFMKAIFKTLCNAGSDPIYIPRNKFHFCSPSNQINAYLHYT